MSDEVSAPPSATVTIDEQGRVVEVDRHAEEVFGLLRHEVQGRPLTELIRQSARFDLRLHVRKVQSAEPPRSPRRESDEGTIDYDTALRALLERVDEAPGSLGTWDWDLEADRLRWSDNLYRLFGLEPGAIEPTLELILEQVHPDDRELVKRAAEDMRQGRVRPLEYRILRPDGELRHLHTWRAVVEEGGDRLRRVAGRVQDITSRRRAERQIAAHVAVTRALANWETLEQATTGLLRSLSEELDCLAGVLWLPEGDVLVARVVWGSGAADTSELRSVIRQLRLPRGVGLAGQVWETGEPATVHSLEDDPRLSAENVPGSHGGLALAAIHDQEVLAVLEFFGCPMGERELDRPGRDSFTGVGHQIGQFLTHHRGHLEAAVLTAREIEVLQLAAQGCSGPEIAERLVVSPATVRTHFKNIYEKYEVSDRAAAVAKALRDGLIE